MDIIAAWMASMPSVEASICEHKKSLVPVAAMLTVAEAMNHLKERQAVRTVSDRTIGEVCLTTTRACLNRVFRFEVKLAEQSLRLT